MIALLRAFWFNHIQKTLAGLLGLLALADLTPWEKDIHELFPRVHHWHAIVRTLAAAGIFWRAWQHHPWRKKRS